jgi:hypothetical protein
VVAGEDKSGITNLDQVEGETEIETQGAGRQANECECNSGDMKNAPRGQYEDPGGEG